MKIRTLAFLVLFLAIAVFAILNWSTFTSRTSLSLGVTSVEAPLGLIMLALLVLLTALFIAFAAYLQAAALVDARHHARGLEASRRLAEDAEASRFTELHRYMVEAFTRLEALGETSKTDMRTWLNDCNHDLRSAIEGSGNTLAAYLGELEDRFIKGVDRHTS